MVLGLDDEAATARELDLIRGAGAEIVEVPLERGPIFTNVETLAGRIQTCGSLSDPVPIEALAGGVGERTGLGLRAHRLRATPMNGSTCPLPDELRRVRLAGHPARTRAR